MKIYLCVIISLTYYVSNISAQAPADSTSSKLMINVSDVIESESNKRNKQGEQKSENKNKKDNSLISPQSDLTLSMDTGDYNRKEFVFDLAHLFNPTLKDKFEYKLSEYNERSGLRIRMLTIPKSLMMEVDKYKHEYLEKENDVLIFLLPRIDNARGQLHIFTMNTASEILPYDTCRSISQEAVKLFIKDDQYEAGMLRAMDSIIEVLDNEQDNEMTTTGLIIRILIILACAIGLYKFSTADFREGKKKMSKGYRLRKRKENSEIVN